MKNVTILSSRKHDNFVAYEASIQVNAPVPINIATQIFTSSQICSLETNASAPLVESWKNCNVVIALHGYLDNSNTFLPIAPYLCSAIPKFIMIAIDYAGCGKSEHKKDSSYPVLENVLLVYQIVQLLKLKKFGIIGHSLGSNVGLTFSSAFPEFVDYLVCIDAFGFRTFDAEGDQASVVLRKSVLRNAAVSNGKKKKVYKSKEELAQKLKQQYVLGIHIDSARALVERGSKEQDGGYIFSYDVRQLMASYSNLVEKQNITFVRDLKCKTFVLYPKAHPWLVALTGKNRLSENPNVSSVELDVDGHHFHMDFPELAAKPIIAFIQEQLARLGANGVAMSKL